MTNHDLMLLYASVIFVVVGELSILFCLLVTRRELLASMPTLPDPPHRGATIINQSKMVQIEQFYTVVEMTTGLQASRKRRIITMEFGILPPNYAIDIAMLGSGQEVLWEQRGTAISGNTSRTYQCGQDVAYVMLRIRPTKSISLIKRPITCEVFVKSEEVKD